MSSNHYDLLVIGGGIHGVGVALAASAAGYRVLLLEQGELASGTSSRSSKLIHGGLRYLEHGQFSLVRECLRERKLLLELAPGLVRLRRFYIPIYAGSKRSPFFIRAGLMLYSLLGGGGAGSHFRCLPRREWRTLDGLKTEGLRAVFQYWDGQTDDAALTRAVMNSAQALGAQLKTHANFVGATMGEVDKTAQVATGDVGAAVEMETAPAWKVRYQQNDSQQTCTATVIVNAAGPWANDVLARIDSPLVPIDVELVQGTHLVLEGKLQQGIYYLPSPRDQRPVFVMPMQDAGEAMGDAILLGTTETPYTGDPGNVHPLPAEQDYLLETYRYYFSSSPHVRTAFAGLRVLPVGAGQPAGRPRETVLHADCPDAPRLVTIYGGKLTAYRATAEKVMHLLEKRLPHRARIADTRTLILN